jgi:DNA-binding transcriptional ArsR family regulator
MDTFTALAEPTRRNILEMLNADGSLSATEIYSRFSVSPPAISQHLKVLRDAELVRVEKRAQQRIYYTNPGPMRELEKWVHRFAAQTEDRYQRLDKVLEQEKLKMKTKTKKETR